MKFNINITSKMNAEMVDYIFKKLKQYRVTDIANIEENFSEITSAIASSLILYIDYELSLDICGVNIYLKYELDT